MPWFRPGFREAVLGPVRELGSDIASASIDSIRAVKLADFSDALQVCGMWPGSCRIQGIVAAPMV